MTNRVQMLISNEFRPDPRLLKEAGTLVRAGYEVQVLAWDREGSGLPRRERMQGIQVRRFRIPGGRYRAGLRQLPGYVIFLLAALFWLLKHRRSFDLIHAHEVDTLPLAVSTKLLLRKRLIVDFHELYSGHGHGTMARLMRFVEQRFLPYADAVLVVNEEQAAFYGPMLRAGTPMGIIPNYPEKQHLVMPHREDHPFTVSYYGNVRNRFELEGLLKATKCLGDVRVLIAGHGPDAQGVRELVRNYPNASYLGPFRYADLPQLYAMSDVVYAVFALDRNMQTAYPVKMWEALACGQPVLVTSGSVAERFVVEHGVGFGVSGRNSDEIAERVENIRSNYRALASRATELSTQYTWEHLEPTLLGVFVAVEGGERAKARGAAK
jgi:glycosyltransferase involved in cell wall biosynthesis